MCVLSMEVFNYSVKSMNEAIRSSYRIPVLIHIKFGLTFQSSMQICELLQCGMPLSIQMNNFNYPKINLREI